MTAKWLFHLDSMRQSRKDEAGRPTGRKLIVVTGNVVFIDGLLARITDQVVTGSTPNNVQN